MSTIDWDKYNTQKLKQADITKSFYEELSRPTTLSNSKRKKLQEKMLQPTFQCENCKRSMTRKRTLCWKCSGRQKIMARANLNIEQVNGSA